MELLVANDCTNITITTPTKNTIEDWLNGNLFDIQIAISNNCQTANILDLPNFYDVQVQGLNDSTVGTVTSYTNFNITFDTSTVASFTLDSTTAGILSYVTVDEYTYTDLDVDNTFVNTMIFKIVDTRGIEYDFVITFTPLPGFGVVFTSELIAPLPCGLLVDNVLNTITILGDYFSSNCTGDTTVILCNGIYSTEILGDKSCVLVDCSLACEVIDSFSKEESDIILYYEALKLGSLQTSIGNTDCIDCQGLCDIFEKVVKLLGLEFKKTSTDGCGCH